MEEKELYFIREIREIFLKYGIKSVSMDDIARELGVSKKTLYQYFEDKTDLVKKILDAEMQDNLCYESISAKGCNAIDLLLMVSKHLSEKLARISPTVTYDLQKYYPEVWKQNSELRRQHILDQIAANFQQGIEEGLYRKDLNVKIITYFYFIRLENILSIDTAVEWLKNIDFKEIFTTMFIYHIRGIANQKGIDYLEKKLMNTPIES